MMQMKNLCIVLDGVICRGKYSEKRLLCPRAFPSLEGVGLCVQSATRARRPVGLNGLTLSAMRNPTLQTEERRESEGFE
jgi:hypothetical protein